MTPPRVDNKSDGILVTGVYDPILRRQLSLEEAVGTGTVDLKSAVYVNRVTGEKHPLVDAIKCGYLSVQRPETATDGKGVIRRSLVLTGAENGTDLEALVEAASQRGGNESGGGVNRKVYEQVRNFHGNRIVDPASGLTVRVDKAARSGLLKFDPLGIAVPDGSGGLTLDEAVAADLIDAKLVRDLLSGLEAISLQKLLDNGILDVNSGQYRDPDTGIRMPISDAIATGKLDPDAIFYTDPASGNVVSLGSAIKSGQYDPQSGTFTNSATGREVRLADAISEGLLTAAVNADEVATRAAVVKALGRHADVSVGWVSDSLTGQRLSLAEAIMAGVLDRSRAKYVDRKTGENLPLSTALDAGLISPEAAKHLLAAMDENSLERSNIDLRTGHYVDPDSGQRMSIQEAVEAGLVEPAAIFLVDSTSGEFTTLASLMENFNDSLNDELGNCRSVLTGNQLFRN